MFFVFIENVIRKIEENYNSIPIIFFQYLIHTAIFLPKPN